MNITPETTVKSILDAYPDAVSVFEKHGVVFRMNAMKAFSTLNSQSVTACAI
jgi:hypothetical protein